MQQPKPAPGQLERGDDRLTRSNVLTPNEIAEAERLIRAAEPGIYELKALYGSRWANVQSPTTFGKRFKQAVQESRLKNIRFANTASDNHAIYEVYR